MTNEFATSTNQGSLLTQTVCDGDQSLEDFLIDMARVVPSVNHLMPPDLGSPVPEEFAVPTEVIDEVPAAEAEVERLVNINVDGMPKLMRDNQAKVTAALDASIAEKSAALARIRDMMKTLASWSPPTEGHTVLKSSGIQYLSERELSISNEIGRIKSKIDAKQSEESPELYHQGILREARQRLARSKNSLDAHTQNAADVKVFMEILKGSIVSEG